jgi:hypothetical protein
MPILDDLVTRGPLPRVIRPATHAILDYMTTAYFMFLGAYFWRRHRRAAATALLNGLAVLGTSMLTDYPGGLGVISFKAHGKIDVMQAGMAAGLPVLLGFADEAAAIPFTVQAGNEMLVVGLTDFEAGGPGGELRLPRQLRDKVRRAA